MDVSSQQVIQRHPIRGALYGLLLGLGAALFLIGQKVVAFGTLPPLLVILLGIALGVAWAFLAPARTIGGPPVVEPDRPRWQDNPPDGNPQEADPTA